MNQKNFIPPLGHATPDPNHKRAADRRRPVRHQKSAAPAQRRGPDHRTERLVLGIVWGAVASLLGIAIMSDLFRKPPRELTRYERAMDRVRGLNSQMREWFSA